jgi:hypothetical protein
VTKPGGTEITLPRSAGRQTPSPLASVFSPVPTVQKIAKSFFMAKDLRTNSTLFLRHEKSFQDLFLPGVTYEQSGHN